MDKTTWGQVMYLLFGSYIGYILFDYFLYRKDFKRRIPIHSGISVLCLAFLIWCFAS